MSKISIVSKVEANYAYLAQISANVDKKREAEKAAQTPKKGA